MSGLCPGRVAVASSSSDSTGAWLGRWAVHVEHFGQERNTCDKATHLIFSSFFTRVFASCIPSVFSLAGGCVYKARLPFLSTLGAAESMDQKLFGGARFLLPVSFSVFEMSPDCGVAFVLRFAATFSFALAVAFYSLAVEVRGLVISLFI